MIIHASRTISPKTFSEYAGKVESYSIQAYVCHLLQALNRALSSTPGYLTLPSVSGWHNRCRRDWCNYINSLHEYYHFRPFFARSMCALSFRCFSLKDTFFLLRTAPLLSIIMIGLFLAFSRFVELLGVSFFCLPLFDPNFSRPSRPFWIDAMRSA